ncbi:MAG: D-glycero-beta-D-manno-heptose 1-phosphate adenylyltransferase [bacterium]|jgi:D-beta-D-heptose 7-phosphate kinase/D-beta-D-heptose 1-phosphate adenosyltransferase
MGKVLNLEDLRAEREDLRRRGKTFVFTNGCFDIIHRGHVEILKSARGLGDVLAVGVNSDDSMRRLKGPRRPIVSEDDRAAVVAALACVDFVTIFEDDTPERIIKALVPDVLVKGSDYELPEIVGRETVESAGGKVARLELFGDYSTESMLRRIAEIYGEGGVEGSSQG